MSTEVLDESEELKEQSDDDGGDGREKVLHRPKEKARFELLIRVNRRTNTVSYGYVDTTYDVEIILGPDRLEAWNEVLRKNQREAAEIALKKTLFRKKQAEADDDEAKNDQSGP